MTNLMNPAIRGGVSTITKSPSMDDAWLLTCSEDKESHETTSILLTRAQLEALRCQIDEALAG